MAIPYARWKKVSRRGKPQGGQRTATLLDKGQSGRSAVAAAAYAAGVRLTDRRTGKTYDFRAKGGVYQSFIVGGGGWTGKTDRARLWNMAEAADGRCNSATAREMILALPHELTHEQRLELARQIAHDLADRHGTIVDVSLHMPNREGDQRNFHAHILMTTRRVLPDGSLGEKTRELDDRRGGNLLREQRAQMEARFNAALAAAGVDARVDFRSYEDQGVNKVAQLKEGVSATNARRKNFRTNPERRGEKTFYERNLASGAVVPRQLVTQLVEIENQLRANEKELADLTRRQLVLPREGRGMRFAKGTPTADRFLVRVAVAFSRQLKGLLNLRQVLHLAASAVEQAATDTQRAAAIRMQDRALRAQAKAIIARMLRESQGGGQGAGAAAAAPDNRTVEAVRRMRRRRQQDADAALVSRRNAGRRAAIEKAKRPPAAVRAEAAKRRRPQKARYNWRSATTPPPDRPRPR